LIELISYSKTVPVDNLRLEYKYDDSVPESLRFKHSSYTLSASDALTPEAILLILQMHPIFVIQKKNYLTVVAGKRIFKAAAFSLPPSEEIPVRVLHKNITKEQLLLLRYMDITISSLMFRTEVSAFDIYRNINLNDFRNKVWRPPLDKGKRAFAFAIQVKPAALSTGTAKTVVDVVANEKAEECDSEKLLDARD
jgi:hypothetical protein